ncbi:putative membrane protein [Burkholderia pseudomallei TSV44]|nr:putative membrane protein [Burkholderia pseudomallei]KGS05077.1 putative membrane protein [Burkholderia pseudomallei MSHR5608]KGX61526.1 putative membrane protein [Burkholderia pseudomallei TSV44]
MLTLPWSCLANLVSQTLCVAAATAAPFWFIADCRE